MKQPTRREYVKLAALGTVGLAGCSGRTGESAQTTEGGGGTPGSGGGTPTSGGTTTSSQSGGDWIYDQPQNPGPEIRYQNLGGMSGDPAAVKNIRAFEDKFPDLKINPVVTDPDSVLQFARGRLQGQDTKFDVYSLATTDLWSLSPEGYLEEISDHIDQKHLDGLLDSFVETSRQPQPFHQDFQPPEGLYGVPGVGTEETWQPFVNMDILEEAGYDRRRTFDNWADFRDVMADIKSQGVADPPVIFPFSTFREGGNIMDSIVARAGGQYFDGRTPNIKSSGVRKGVDNFLQLFRDGLATGGVTSLREGNTTQQFFGGEAAVMFNTSSNIFLPGKELPVDKPASKVARVAQYPQPEGVSGTPTVNLTPINFSLSVFSPNKQNAVKWMNYYASREAQKTELVTEGNLSINMSVYDDSDVQQMVPYADVFRRTLEEGIVMQYPQPSAFRQMVYDTMTAAIANDLSTDRVLNQIQSGAQQLV